MASESLVPLTWSGAPYVQVSRTYQRKGHSSMDIYPPAAQRPPLLKFAKAIGARSSAIRRDECGDWRINGSHGHIFAISGSLDEPKCPGFQFLVMDWTAKGWSNARRALSFAKLTNDGDDEGAFFLNRLPTTDEADVIRHYCGITKRRDLSDTPPSEAQLAARAAFAARRRLKAAA